jgi:hypothetical protein
MTRQVTPLTYEERQSAYRKMERLLSRGERDARLLDGQDFKYRPWAEAKRLLDLLREQDKEENANCD